MCKTDTLVRLLEYRGHMLSGNIGQETIYFVCMGQLFGPENKISFGTRPRCVLVTRKRCYTNTDVITRLTSWDSVLWQHPHWLRLRLLLHGTVQILLVRLTIDLRASKIYGLTTYRYSVHRCILTHAYSAHYQVQPIIIIIVVRPLSITILNRTLYCFIRDKKLW